MDHHVDKSRIIPAKKEDTMNNQDGDTRTIPEDMGLESFDWAIPQDWLDNFKANLNQSSEDKWTPVGEMVWCYDGSSLFGYPVGLTHRARKELGSLALYGLYQHTLAAQARR